MTSKNEAMIQVPLLSHEAVEICLLGISPLILHEMSEKVRRELLMPKGKKSVAEKATTIKHDPLTEFRNSARVISAPDAPTLLAFPTPAIKSCLMTAALRLPGAKKTEIAQLCWISGYSLPIWGIPEIFMAVTRSGDMARTPDIRSRPMLKHWATKVVVNFMVPHLNVQTIVNLLSGGGLLAGIGDFRQEKGKGSYGQFRVCKPDDEEFLSVIDGGGRQAQIAAMENPAAADPETEKLLSWFQSEIDVRGKRGQLSVVNTEKDVA